MKILILFILLIYSANADQLKEAEERRELLGNIRNDFERIKNHYSSQNYLKSKANSNSIQLVNSDFIKLKPISSLLESKLQKCLVNKNHKLKKSLVECSIMFFEYSRIYSGDYQKILLNKFEKFTRINSHVYNDEKIFLIALLWSIILVNMHEEEKAALSLKHQLLHSHLSQKNIREIVYHLALVDIKNNQYDKAEEKMVCLLKNKCDYFPFMNIDDKKNHNQSTENNDEDLNKMKIKVKKSLIYLYNIQGKNSADKNGNQDLKANLLVKNSQWINLMNERFLESTGDLSNLKNYYQEAFKVAKLFGIDKSIIQNLEFYIKDEERKTEYYKKYILRYQNISQLLKDKNDDLKRNLSYHLNLDHYIYKNFTFLIKRLISYLENNPVKHTQDPFQLFSNDNLTQALTRWFYINDKLETKNLEPKSNYDFLPFEKNTEEFLKFKKEFSQKISKNLENLCIQINNRDRELLFSPDDRVLTLCYEMLNFHQYLEKDLFINSFQFYQRELKINQDALTQIFTNISQLSSIYAGYNNKTDKEFWNLNKILRKDFISAADKLSLEK